MTLHHLYTKWQFKYDSLDHLINNWKVYYAHCSCQCLASIRQKFLSGPSSYIILPTLSSRFDITRGRGIYNINYIFPSQFSFISPWRTSHSIINSVITNLNLSDKYVSSLLHKVRLVVAVCSFSSHYEIENMLQPQLF